MPARWLCLLIALFWLACNGCLFWSELLPWLVPGRPPPYTIDLVEEARTQRPWVFWVVYQDGSKVLNARTFIEHEAHTDVFEQVAEYSTIDRRRAPVPTAPPLL